MSEDGLIVLIQTHLTRYPESEVADVYKLLHQATFGSGHMITDKRAAREFLQQECDQIAPSTNAGLLECIHPAGEIVRMYLRPYLALTTRVNWLLDAFVRSAGQVEGDPAVMAERWSQFESLCETDTTEGKRFGLREAQLFGRVRSGEGWPAVHHSPAYVRTYQPKYRVLTRAEAEDLCARLKVPFEAV